MITARLKPPDPVELLQAATEEGRPVAVVVAGHNGSGKSTLWYDKLADSLKMPLINADRLTLSILPLAADGRTLRPWAAALRDQDERWQRVSQQGVQRYLELAMAQRLSFAYETVFSFLQSQPDGTFRSKLDTIVALQTAGYFVVLLFVGLADVELSVIRVATRRLQGGHDVPEVKLRQRFPRTQQAIRLAASQADMTLMFDNSRGLENALTLVRAQVGNSIQYDCRDRVSLDDPGLQEAAAGWLSVVAPQ